MSITAQKYPVIYREDIAQDITTTDSSFTRNDNLNLSQESEYEATIETNNSKKAAARIRHISVVHALVHSPSP